MEMEIGGTFFWVFFPRCCYEKFKYALILQPILHNLYKLIMIQGVKVLV